MAYRFIHILWQVRNVEVRVLIITFGLETRVERLLDDVSEVCKINHHETHSSESYLVAEMVEATNAKLRMSNVVVLREAKS